MTDINRVLTEALHHHRSGDLERASQLYQGILDTAPDHPDALHLSGLVAHQRGNHATAVDLINRAIAGHPNEPRYYANRGLALHAAGRLAEAESSLRRALDLDPRSGANLFKLGNVLAAMERPREAADAFGEACDLDPDNPAFQRNLALALREAQQLEAAGEAYDRAIALEPKSAEAHSGRAVVLHRLGRLEDANVAYRTALDLAGDHPAAVGTRALLGHSLMESGHVEEAVAELHAAYAGSGQYEEEICRCAVDLYRRGHTEPALALLARLVEIDRESPRVTAMIALFEAVLSPTDAALERIEGLLHQHDLPREVERSLRFGIGRLLDRADRFDEAFAHIAAGNQLSEVVYDAAGRREYVDDCCAMFSQERVATLRRATIASELPVFIVGMPRSGTTLVEQILASHPQVHGADELADIEDMVRTLPESVGAAEPFPLCMTAVTSALATQLAADYLAKLERLGRGASRVTDKMPHNFLYLGLIACLFPHSRIVHCMRDPLDCGLSNYFQDFDTVALGYSTDLTHIGEEYRQYGRLMGHWRAVLELPILDVAYESLVAEPERVSREVVAFCGLEWDARCLSFHDNPRHVRTWSFDQVREPIYQRAVGRSRHYAAHLAPLAAALAADA